MATPTVEQIAQVGIEATPGVAVPATWRPTAFSLALSPSDETDELRPAGSYWVTASWLLDTRSEGEAEGAPCYVHLQRVLDLVAGAATTVDPVTDATVTNGPALFERAYTLQPDRTTWTVELGDREGGGSRASHVYATSFSLEWGRNSRTAAMTLGLGGGLFEDDVELTPAADVTALPVSIITPLQVELYADLDAGAYGDTRVDYLLSATLTLEDLASATAYMRADRQSISEAYATAPGASIEIMVDANAAGRGWRRLLLDGSVRYVRLLARNPATGESFTVDTPVRVVETGDRGDEDGQHVARYTLRITAEGDEQLRMLLRNTVEGVAAPATPPAP